MGSQDWPHLAQLLETVCESRFALNTLLLQVPGLQSLALSLYQNNQHRTACRSPTPQRSSLIGYLRQSVVFLRALLEHFEPAPGLGLTWTDVHEPGRVAMRSICPHVDEQIMPVSPANGGILCPPSPVHI